MPCWARGRRWARDGVGDRAGVGRRNRDERARALSGRGSARARRSDAGLVHAPGRSQPARIPRTARAVRLPHRGQDAGALRRGDADAGPTGLASTGRSLFADIMLPLDGMGVPFRIDPGVGPVIPDPIRTERRHRAAAGDRGGGGDALSVRSDANPARRSWGNRRRCSGFPARRSRSPATWSRGARRGSSRRRRRCMYGDPDLWAHADGDADRGRRSLPARADRGRRRGGAALRFLVGSARPGHLRASGPALHAADLRRTGRSWRRRFTSAPARSQLLDQIASAGSDIVSVDWRLPLDAAWERIGSEHGIQGNLDPSLLLAPFAAVATGARDVLRRAGGRPGHIFNLGHGILPETPVEHLERLVALVHAESHHRASG